MRCRDRCPVHYDQRTQHADHRPRGTQTMGRKRVDHIKAVAIAFWIFLGFVAAVIAGWCATAWWYAHYINGPNG